MAISNDVVIQNKVGLHARPAALFVKTAAQFSSVIHVENVTKGTAPINAKSVLRLLSAGIQKDDQLRIHAEGADEQVAVETLSRLVITNFGETE